jgi:flagellar hook-basal body complex protein FliE
LGAAAVRGVGIQQGERGGIRIPLQKSGSGPSFSETLAEAIGQVSDLQTESHDTISAFLRGDPVEIHEVMTAVEEAGLALEMLIEVRNKVTEAYRTIINMQT